MPTSAHSTASPSDDPALLRVEGPIASITLNRPSAFNSIDLSIAKKLEQLSAEVEASDDIRVLVIEGEGRAFCGGGDLQTIGAAAAADNIAPVVGEMLSHYHTFITTLRRMPKIVLASVHGSAPAPAFRSPSSRTSASPRRTPASPRPMPSSGYRLTAAARSALQQASARGARYRYFSPKTAFRRPRHTIGVWSRKSFPRPS